MVENATYQQVFLMLNTYYTMALKPVFTELKYLMKYMGVPFLAASRLYMESVDLYTMY